MCVFLHIAVWLGKYNLETQPDISHKLVQSTPYSSSVLNSIHYEIWTSEKNRDEHSETTNYGQALILSLQPRQSQLFNLETKLN